MVDFNELADKAKGLVGEHADKIKSGIEKTGEFVGDKIGHDKVNPIEEKAKGLVDKLSGDQAPAAQPPTAQSPTAQPPTAQPPTAEPPAAQEPAAPAPEPPATPPATPPAG